MTTSATRRENDLWLLETLVPGTAVNNLSVVFEVAGRLSEQRLRCAVQAVVRRHTALRTVFRADDRGLAKDVRDVEVPLDVEEVAGAAADEEELRERIARPFALDGGPLLRVALLRGTTADTVCLVAHHLIFDAMSGGIVLAELIAAYEAYAVPDPRPEEASGAEPALSEPVPSAASLEFWKRHLDGYRADGLALWCDQAGDPPVTLAGEVHHHVLSEAADAGVSRLRRELRAPRAVALLTGYCLTLARHGAGPDLVVGVPASTRSTSTQQAVGYHVNMLPLRAGLDPRRTVREVAAELRAGFFEALAHPDVPAETFLPQDRGDRPAWRNTLFRHVFNYVPTDFRTTFTLDGAPAVQRLVESGTCKYDLEFFLSESAETALLSVLFNSQVLRRDDVAALVARFDHLLAALPDLLDTRLDELPRWSAEDTAALPATARASAGRAGDGPHEIVETVRRTAEEFPDRAAVRADGATLSYAALWEAARAAQPRPGQESAPAREAIALLRSLTGADGESDGETPPRQVAATAADLARGVGLPPGGLVHRSAGPRTGAAALESLLALACGGTAVGPKEAETAADLVHGTPAELRMLLRAAGPPLSGTRVVSSGEPLPPALAAELLERGAQVFHAHRPAGERQWVAVRRITDPADAPVPGGTPLAGAAPFVAAPDGGRLPRGLRGRLGLVADGVPRLTDELALWRPDGTLEVLGAAPETVAELALLAHPSVTEAAVVALPSGDGDGEAAGGPPAPVGYVVIEGPARDDARIEDVLRGHCQATVPRAAVPQRFVLVEGLPVRGGLIDRERLATAAAAPVADPGEPEPAADDALTASLARVWGEFLERAVDADTNFFSEGGHSLLGAQLVQRVKRATGAALRLADLFANPTPRAFGALLSGPDHGISDPVD